jgi:hypothetical protein
MVLPQGIATLLSSVEGLSLPGVPATGQCAGSKFHSPTPLLLHEVELPRGTTALVCGTCRDNLQLLTELTRHTEGSLPWTIRREFGNNLRALFFHDEG